MTCDCALVVDDSVVQRNHAVALCRALGITTVQTASNGREAIALLCDLTPSPDLLILDLEMPTMDGAQLLQQLQQHGIDVPIVLASSRELSLLDLVRDGQRARLEHCRHAAKAAQLAWPAEGLA